MGNPISPILCDFYMDDFEKKLFQRIAFPYWKRYVNDTFCLVNCSSEEDVPSLLNLINSLDPHIQFTCEEETNNTLPFLDVLVLRNPDSFQTSVFRKPFAVALPPHRRSCQPFPHKIAAFRYYVDRAFRICSTTKARDEEFTILKAVAADRGYDPLIINLLIDSQKKSHHNNNSLHIDFERATKCFLPYSPVISKAITKFLKAFDIITIHIPHKASVFGPPKDRISHLRKNGIYQINCNNCNLGYIGQTKRTLKARVTEHQRMVKNMEINKSAIAAHCWENDHVFNFDSARIIQPVPRTSLLDFYEGFHIRADEDVLVNDEKGIPPVSKIYACFWN